MVTKAELYDRATELDIEGRSNMTKKQLEAAIADAEGGGSSGSGGDQSDRLARAKANRDAAIKERNEGRAEAERLERQALADTPSGPQAALLRAKQEEADE